MGLHRRKDSVTTLHDCFFLTLNADDSWFPTALRNKSEAEFASRKDKENFVEYEFKEYKGSFYACCTLVDFGPTLNFRHSAWLRFTSKSGHSWDQDSIWWCSEADSGVVQENSLTISYWASYWDIMNLHLLPRSNVDPSCKKLYKYIWLLCP